MTQAISVGEDVRRPRVLHVSADFPDPVDSAKTKVIRTLLDLTRDGFDHTVISLNRKSPANRDLLTGVLRGFGRPALAVSEHSFDQGTALTYRAPGRGLYHRTMLVQLGDHIAEQLEGQTPPALVVGHKLTVEGIAVLQVADRIGIPYAITIQGDTDTKILAARPDLAPVLRTVFHRAAHVTAFAPWALAAVEERLGKRTGPVSIIPCPTEIDVPVEPQAGGNGLLSVFHLASYKRKNLAAMAQAMHLLAKDGQPQRLAICGGGDVKAIEAARKAASNAPGLVFEGPLERSEVGARMRAASAFVLPSRRETFGLVFIEALFAGLPVIYPAGQAVSGYFDGCPFAIAVPADDPQALAQAMARAVRDEVALKQALARWQQSPDARRFTRPSIASDYSAALTLALRGSNLAPSPIAGAA